MTPEEAEKRIKQLELENRELKETIARAKDPEPRKRPLFPNVKKLCEEACLSLTRKIKNGKTKGFIVALGGKKRLFKRLKDIWLFLTQAEWELDELFPLEPNKPKSGCCKYCGDPIKWEKEWVEEENKFYFRAINPDISVHRCQAYRQFKRNERKELSDVLPIPVWE